MKTEIFKGRIFHALGVEGNIPQNRVVKSKRNFYDCGPADLDYWENLAKEGYAARTEPGTDSFYVTVKGIRALEAEFAVKIVKAK